MIRSKTTVVARYLALLLTLLFFITSCFQPTPPEKEFTYDESDEINLTTDSDYQIESLQYFEQTKGLITQSEFNTLSITDGILGEVGKLSVKQGKRNYWHSYDFTNSYDNPIVIMNPVSWKGHHPATIRIKDVTATGFKFKIDEWLYQNGKHKRETISFMVIEQGRHTINNLGLEIEANTLITNHTFKQQTFQAAFPTTPVILTQTQTVNGSDPVVTRQNNATNTGFEVKLQEEEAQGSHANETIGYIAITPQAGTLEYNNITTQNQTNTTTKNYEIALTPKEVNRQWYTLDFQNTYDDPIFIAGLQTYYGPNTANLRYKNLNNNKVKVKIQEERSQDNETWHRKEVVGYIVFDADTTLQPKPVDVDTAKYLSIITENNAIQDANIVLDLETSVVRFDNRTSMVFATIFHDDGSGVVQAIFTKTDELFWLIDYKSTNGNFVMTNLINGRSSIITNANSILDTDGNIKPEFLPTIQQKTAELFMDAYVVALAGIGEEPNSGNITTQQIQFCEACADEARLVRATTAVVMSLMPVETLLDMLTGIGVESAARAALAKLLTIFSEEKASSVDTTGIAKDMMDLVTTNLLTCHYREPSCPSPRVKNLSVSPIRFIAGNQENIHISFVNDPLSTFQMNYLARVGLSNIYVGNAALIKEGKLLPGYGASIDLPVDCTGDTTKFGTMVVTIEAQDVAGLVLSSTHYKVECIATEKVSKTLAPAQIGESFSRQIMVGKFGHTIDALIGHASPNAANMHSQNPGPDINDDELAPITIIGQCPSEPGSYYASIEFDNASGEVSPSPALVLNLSIACTADDGRWSQQFGDPHLSTPDSNRFHFQAAGDYLLTRSIEADDNFEVQVRYQPFINGAHQWSGEEALAMMVESDKVELYAKPNGVDIYVNEVLTELGNGSLKMDGGGILFINNVKHTLTISWPDGTLLVAALNSPDPRKNLRGFSKIYFRKFRRNKVEGLLGNFDGDFANDHKIRNGEILTNPTEEELYFGGFRDSWAISKGAATSLFSQGSDPYNADFPVDIFRLSDFTNEVVISATEACLNAGVEEPWFLQACVADIAVTGNTNWAYVAAKIDPSKPSIVVSPPFIRIQNNESLDFEAVISRANGSAINWSATGGTIDSNGVYTAPNSEGQYTVTATLVDYPNVQATATVFVSDNFLSLSTTKLVLNPNDSVNITATTAFNEETVWSATFGNITGSGNTRTYTAPTSTGEYLLTVSFANDQTTSITIPIYVLTSELAVKHLRLGQSHQFNWPGSNNFNIDWSATGGSIDSNGVYTAPNSEGQYTVTATLVDYPNVQATSTVFVSDNLLSLSTTKLVLNPNDSVNITATTAFNEETVWSATFGNITGSGNTRTYTAPSNPNDGWSLTVALASDPSVSVTIPIYVLVSSLSYDDITLNPGNTWQLIWAGASSYNINWSVTGGTVDANGLYTAPSELGQYTATATLIDYPSVTATANIVVVADTGSTSTFDIAYGDSVTKTIAFQEIHKYNFSGAAGQVIDIAIEFPLDQYGLPDAFQQVQANLYAPSSATTVIASNCPTPQVGGIGTAGIGVGADCTFSIDATSLTETGTYTIEVFPLIYDGDPPVEYTLGLSLAN